MHSVFVTLSNRSKDSEKEYNSELTYRFHFKMFFSLVIAPFSMRDTCT